MNRKLFLKKTASVLALSGITPSGIFALSPLQNEPPPFDKKLVKEFVVAGHRDMNKLQEMLEEHPNLIYCSYDWGNGDFEEAIEGAGHLGNREIANYLIEKGARVNLFVMAMLGKTSQVTSALEAFPHLINSLGPHGFTLLHHAKAGDAKELEDYLTEKGLTKTHIKIK
ncbi:MAG: hypothetical protein AAF363_09640 [Bacteroidota bacterium]